MSDDGICNCVMCEGKQFKQESETVTVEIPAAVGAYGWPLKPSTIWPGENSLRCPNCDSEHVVMEGIPGHDGRMGSPGQTSKITCKECGCSKLGPIK